MSVEAAYYIPQTEKSFSPRENSQELLNEETGESIFKYYNIDNEVRFIQNYDLPPSQKEYYLKENVKTFLAEFAGKVPFKRITYILRDDGLYYGNINALNNFLQTADMPEATDRERAEAQGFGAVEQGLLTNADASYWISPPKIADYGFVFFFLKDDQYREDLQGRAVTEYILRYKENMREVQSSNRISYHLGSDKYTKTAEDFIRNPMLDADMSEEKVESVLNATGISKDDIAQSRLFENAVDLRLSSLIDQYVDLIFTLSKLPPDSVNYVIEETNAKELLVELFRNAKAIKHIMNEPENFVANNIDNLAPHLIAHYAQNETTEVQGGGSCPSIRRSKGDILSPTSIFELMNEGNPFESKLPFELKNESTCPKCKKDSSDNHYHCPGCGKDYPDETNKRPEDRTKECKVEIGRDPKTGESIKCNFQFGC